MIQSFLSRGKQLFTLSLFVNISIFFRIYANNYWCQNYLQSYLLMIQIILIILMFLPVFISLGVNFLPKSFTHTYTIWIYSTSHQVKCCTSYIMEIIFLHKYTSTSVSDGVHQSAWHNHGCYHLCSGWIVTTTLDSQLSTN